MEHPDERYMLTGEERSQFREIWKELADGEPGGSDIGDTVPVPPGWSVVLMLCVVLVFVGLAVNSVLLVMAATGGGVASWVARRRA
jgi:hypothetical protein